MLDMTLLTKQEEKQLTNAVRTIQDLSYKQMIFGLNYQQTKLLQNEISIKRRLLAKMRVYE